MSDDLESRQMPDWQAAAIALLVAVVIAAIAWAVIDPDGLVVATGEWITVHDQKFKP